MTNSPTPPRNEVFVIHCSQAVATDCSQPTPPVSAIVVQRVGADRAQHTFAASRFAEADGVMGLDLNSRIGEYEGITLTAFYDFGRKHPGATWLHWGMRKATFGFDVIAGRARIHGVDTSGVDFSHAIDIPSALLERYGCDFAGTPRLFCALFNNGMLREEMLVRDGTRDEPKAAWEAGEHARLLVSLAAKVNGIAGLYERVMGETFVTDPACRPLAELQRAWRGQATPHAANNKRGKSAEVLASAERIAAMIAGADGRAPMSYGQIAKVLGIQRGAVIQRYKRWKARCEQKV